MSPNANLVLIPACEIPAASDMEQQLLCSFADTQRFTGELQNMRDAVVRMPDTAERTRAMNALTMASNAHDSDCDYIAWENLQRARRYALATFNEHDLRMEFAERLGEARQKLKGWRLQSAEMLKCRMAQLNSQPEMLAVVRRIHVLLDGHSQNSHFSIALVRQQMWMLFVWLVVIMGFLLWCPVTDTALELRAALGALGAVFSVALMHRRPVAGAIPELWHSIVVNSLRPLLGAASATVLALVFKESLYVLPMCFLSGFSERFFLSRLEEAAGQGKNAPGVSPAPGAG